MCETFVVGWVEIEAMHARCGCSHIHIIEIEIPKRSEATTCESQSLLYTLNNDYCPSCSLIPASVPVSRSLLQQLQKLQSLISGKVIPRSCKMASTQTGTCLMVNTTAAVAVHTHLC